ncbi:hypothetical protein GQA12_15175 [Paenibacillus alvei]|nr:hypothetical protein [Paenibacillus alvei]
MDNEFIEFETINNFKSNNIGIRAISRDRNYKVKFPIKGFHRTPESMSERLLDGTFYEIENTHQIPIEVFIYCMEHKDIGTIGFYLYGYLKYLNDLFKEGAVVSLGRFIKELGIKSSSLDTYLQKLKEHNMITCHEQPFVFGIPERLKKPNTYLVNSYQDFHIKNSPIKIRKVMHVSTDKKIRSSLYEEEVNVREKDDSETVIDFDLPF